MLFMEDKQNTKRVGSACGDGQSGRKAKVGNFLYYSGLCLLLCTVGALLGYYAGAYGWRWLPTMLEILLAGCIAAFVLMIVGRVVEGSAVRLTQKGVRIRKRVLLSSVLISLSLLVRLGVYWSQKPSPLTSLTRAQFNEVFEVDLDNYQRYDAAIEEYIVLLEEYSVNFGDDKNRLLSADEEKRFRDIWIGLYNYAIAMDQIRLFYEDWYRFDPSPAEASYHHRSFMLTFAAELSLYEKSTRFIMLVVEYPNVVKFLDTPHTQNHLAADSFSRFRRQFQGARDSSRVLAGKHYFTWMNKGLKGKEVAMETGCRWLWNKVKQEVAIIDDQPQVALATLTVKSDLEIFKKAVSNAWYPAQKKVALLMANTRIRRGSEYLITPAQQEEMDKALLPGDIMISRKNWHVTNAGLPGFWPHAILYIGAEDKFNRFFDDAAVDQLVSSLASRELSLGEYLAERYPIRWKKYTRGADSGKYRVIESCKYGVILNSFKAAFGDYMAAIRPRLDKKAKAQAIIEAFGHLDKPYDYNFDFATDNALVCTELVWRSYRPAKGKKGLVIDLIDMAGRKTLPANEIIKCYAENKGTKKSQFDFVYFIDAIEKKSKTFVADEKALLKSYKRGKWSFTMD
ncbi:MAG: hypothetical protein FVQ82_03015 [Planctomycetes bacterium]|nr:hypothetical protein [Planctomycetota bacterium]